MSLENAVTGLVGLLEEVVGLSYDDPPESLNEFPVGIAYINSGEITFTASGGYGLHLISVDIYHARQILPQAIDEVKQWPLAIFDALKADQSLGGAVSHVVWPIRYKAGPMFYGNTAEPYYGIHFDIQVKTNHP